MTTKNSKLNKLAQKWDNTDRWVKRILGVFTTTGVVIGLVMGVANWGISKFDAHFEANIQELTYQIEALKQKSDDADLRLQLSSTRLELTTLIAHNPYNTIEIERVARYYFIELGGDWYMSQIYSEWARVYGGDTSFVTHKT